MPCIDPGPFFSCFLLSVEIIRLGNSFYINWDQKMFYEPKNMPAQARTTTLNERSSARSNTCSLTKQGLTQNIMIFNKCSINGMLYGMHIFLLSLNLGEILLCRLILRNNLSLNLYVSKFTFSYSYNLLSTKQRSPSPFSSNQKTLM